MKIFLKLDFYITVLIVILTIATIEIITKKTDYQSGVVVEKNIYQNENILVVKTAERYLYLSTTGQKYNEFELNDNIVIAHHKGRLGFVDYREFKRIKR